MADESTPWATGLTVAGFVAAATAVAVVVLSLGLIRVHPMLAVGLNVVAAGRLAPTLVPPAWCGDCASARPWAPPWESRRARVRARRSPVVRPAPPAAAADGRS